MELPKIYSINDMSALIEELGFLPFFKHDIEGFSIEECCGEGLWFAHDTDGPWEWKGPVAQNGKCFYGKFFGGKAGFISTKWFPDFSNYRRDGYDFDARYDDGIARHKDKVIYDTITQQGEILSKKLKELCNYKKGGNVGFETVITRLQMQTYVCISDFTYMQDKSGRPYGWGVAKYSTPEKLYGYEFIEKGYETEPEKSKARIVEHLLKTIPDATEAQIFKLIK